MIALDARLQSLKTGQPQQDALVELFTALAAKAHEVSRIISAGGELGNTIGDQNADGDAQKALDVMADEESSRQHRHLVLLLPIAARNKIRQCLLTRLLR